MIGKFTAVCDCMSVRHSPTPGRRHRQDRAVASICWLALFRGQRSNHCPVEWIAPPFGPDSRAMQGRWVVARLKRAQIEAKHAAAPRDRLGAFMSYE